MTHSLTHWVGYPLTLLILAGFTHSLTHSLTHCNDD